MMQAVLTVNVGSSSLKAALFDAHTGMNIDRLHLKGAIDDTLLATLIAWVSGQNKSEVKNLVAVAHRVVHGGADYTAPTRLTPSVMQQLETLVPFAPLHQPNSLKAIQQMQKTWPDVPHLAVFDTSFHATNQALHTCMPVPQELHVRRFGFHGLSYQNVAKLVPQGRVVAAHLGSGASVCALLNGKSVATSMGLTALDGLPMGTRCGALDPGAVLYVAQRLGVDKTQHILYEESGLKALCGFSDWQSLRATQTAEAAFAYAYFAERVAETIAALCVSIGGLDTLVFTGGIGENDAQLAHDVTAKLSFLPSFETRTIRCDEERMMFEDLKNNNAA